MKKLLLLTLAVALTWPNIFAQSSVDAVLKNGRAVTYYKTGGLYLRDLEPEENEYQQWAVAKTANICKSVEIPGYKRVERMIPDMEDLQRSREDDRSNLPVHFKVFLEYRPEAGTELAELWAEQAATAEVESDLKVYIAIEANVRNWSIKAMKPFGKTAQEDLEHAWFSEHAAFKGFSKRHSYEGPVTVLFFGNASGLTKSADAWTIKGLFPQASMCSVSNIVITIGANEANTAAVLETFDRDKVFEVLRFKERWP